MAKQRLSIPSGAVPLMSAQSTGDTSLFRLELSNGHLVVMLCNDTGATCYIHSETFLFHPDRWYFIGVTVDTEAKGVQVVVGDYADGSFYTSPVRTYNTPMNTSSEADLLIGAWDYEHEGNMTCASMAVDDVFIETDSDLTAYALERQFLTSRVSDQGNTTCDVWTNPGTIALAQIDGAYPPVGNCITRAVAYDITGSGKAAWDFAYLSGSTSLGGVETSTSSDLLNWTDWSPVDGEGNITSPVAEYIQYKHAFVQGHYNLTLPGMRETDCTWVYHSFFRGFYNTVTAFFSADAALSYIDSVLREFRAWYASDDIMLGLPAAGRLYGSNGTVSDLPFGTIAGYMLGTRSLAEGQPLAGFAGVYNPTELTTTVLPYVYDYAAQSVVLRPQALTDSTGQSLSPQSLSLFAIARRHPPPPVVYWRDRFLNYDTLENYNSDDGEYSVEEDWEGETNQSYLAGRGTLLYKARTFSNFYASLTFLKPSDRTSYFGITGIICGNLMVVYNDPYDRIEVRQGPYLNDRFILTTYSCPLERSDQPFAAPHWFKLEVRKRGNVVTVYYGGKPVINQAVSATSGYVGVYSHYITMCSELIIGDAYKYQARESTSLSLAGHSYTFGRVTRTGAAWNGSVFTLSGTNEEVNSRSVELAGKLESFSLGEAESVTIGSDALLTVSTDPGAELDTICLCDSHGGGVVQFRSSLDLQELYNREVFNHGFAGLALDGLGAEDSAIWGLV